jgi:hypothetical protein
MQAYKLRTTVPPDREITLRVPDEVPSGEVEIVFLVPDHAEGSASVPGSTAQDILAYLDKLPAPSNGGRSKEEIDRYILEERQTWD